MCPKRQALNELQDLHHRLLGYFVLRLGKLDGLDPLLLENQHNKGGN